MRGVMVLAVGFAFAVSGCAGTDDGEEGREVEVDDDYFEVSGEPASKNATSTAAVGEKFEFNNEGQRSHTVTIHRPPDPVTTYLIDETLVAGDETSFTFDKAGTYHIWCRFHGEMTSGMHLTVTVP